MIRAHCIYLFCQEPLHIRNSSWCDVDWADDDKVVRWIRKSDGNWEGNVYKQRKQIVAPAPRISQNCSYLLYWKFENHWPHLPAPWLFWYYLELLDTVYRGMNSVYPDMYVFLISWYIFNMSWHIFSILLLLDLTPGVAVYPGISGGGVRASQRFTPSSSPLHLFMPQSDLCLIILFSP